MMTTPRQRFPGSHNSVGGVGSPDVSQIARILANLIRVGKVVKSDPEKATFDLDFGDNKPVALSQMTGRAGEDQTYSIHSDGEQLLVLCPDGDLSKGHVLGALYKKGTIPFKKREHSGEKKGDGTVIRHDTKAKARATIMPKDGKHGVSVDKNTQVVDARGTRLQNDKGVVDLDSDGTIKKVNKSGGMVVHSGGNVYINC